MLVYIFIIYCLVISCFSLDLLSILWDEEDVKIKRVLNGLPVTDEESNKLISRLSQLPFTAELKSEAWYKLVKSQVIQNFKVKDWDSYKVLIPYLPLELFRHINFSDQHVMNYFGEQELKQFHLSFVAEMMSEKWGLDVLMNEDRIFKMGNFFCGFSTTDMKTIDNTILRSLLLKGFFRKLHCCDAEKLQNLATAIQSYTVIGPTSTWNSETVDMAGTLLAGLNIRQAREIQDKSFATVSPEVIAKMPKETLQQIRNAQLQALSRPSLLAWRKRTKDLRPLHSFGHEVMRPLKFKIILFGIILNWWAILSQSSIRN